MEKIDKKLQNISKKRNRPIKIGEKLQIVEYKAVLYSNTYHNTNESQQNFEST